MRKINILIVTHDVLTPTLKELYCIEDLKKEFNVQFISLRNFFHGKELICYNDELADEFIEFDTLSKFKKYLKTFPVKSTYIFIDNFATSLWAIYVDYIIRKFKLCKFILYRTFEVELKKNNTINKIKYLCNKKLLVQFLVRKYGIKRYHMVFSAGKRKSMIESRKHIPLNSTVKVNDGQKHKTDNICVFIEQGFPTHPDLILHKNLDQVLDGINVNKIRNFIDTYNNFFDYIENKYKTRVVIAKHPKSSIPDEYFNGRQVIKKKSNELIIKSRFVISHYSLISNVAIEFYKPVLIIYNNLFMKFKSNFEMIQMFSKLLCTNIINIEDYDDSDINLTINKSKYEQFIKDYIVIDSKMKNHEIITKALIGDFEEQK